MKKCLFILSACLVSLTSFASTPIYTIQPDQSIQIGDAIVQCRDFQKGQQPVTIMSSYCVCEQSGGETQDLILIQTMTDGTTTRNSLGTFKAPGYSTFGLNKSCPSAMKDRSHICGLDRK